MGWTILSIRSAWLKAALHRDMVSGCDHGYVHLEYAKKKGKQEETER